MLSDAPVSAILPSENLVVSKDFYQNKLGLKLVPAPMEDPLMFEAGDKTILVVYYRPDGTKAEHTVAGFMVSDIEQKIEQLEDQGVEFEDYDLEDLKTINHIMSYGDVKSAWFKDPDGNILALNQM